MYFDKSHFTDAALVAHGEPSPLHGFVTRGHDALQHAADLLGGSEGRRLVHELASALEHRMVVTPRARRLAERLHDLLTLQNVHDETGVEAMLFSRIDPADPVVEQVCMLADGLGDALSATGIDDRNIQGAA